MPFISVIVPCRNEAGYISQCLDSIIANSYPKDRTEILVIDGMSEDNTGDIVREYENKYPYICLFDNPKKVLAAAWNIGIKKAKGDIIMTLNAHGVFRNDYISNCEKHFRQYDADYIGGIIISRPRNNNYADKAITIALSNGFGVGNSYFRIGLKKPMLADTAAFGGYRKEIFGKIGLYKEDLDRSQDMEFHSRLRKMGGKILLAPDMICDYYLRSGLKDFIKDSFVNGFWVLYPFKFTNIAVSLRHLTPMVFIVSIICLAFLSKLSIIFWWFLLFISALYISAGLYNSFRIAVKEKDPGLLFIMPVLFAILHVGYGLGTCYGGFKALIAKEFRYNHRIKTDGSRKEVES